MAPSSQSQSQPRLRLHHAAPSRSSTVLWMLEELGEPYDLHVLDLKAGEQRTPAYLAINPMGKVPALEHDGVLITEVGAICLYLADAYPKAGLAPTSNTLVAPGTKSSSMDEGDVLDATAATAYRSDVARASTGDTKRLVPLPASPRAR